MRGDPEGEYYKSIIDGGSLVPDEIVLKLVEKIIARPECARGAIFDGFPRTLPQAEALSRMVDIDVTLSIEVEDDLIVRRMEGRRTCPNCQRTYHLEDNPPKMDGICNSCGSILGMREDDMPGVISHRLDVYHQRTEPIKEFYKGLGLYKEISGEGDVEDTRQKVFAALEGFL